MAKMKLTLPDPMKECVEGRARDGRLCDASDYVRHPIRDDQERQEEFVSLQREIPAGIESGAPRRLHQAAFKARMRKARGPR